MLHKETAKTRQLNRRSHASTTAIEAITTAEDTTMPDAVDVVDFLVVVPVVVPAAEPEFVPAPLPPDVDPAELAADVDPAVADVAEVAELATPVVAAPVEAEVLLVAGGQEGFHVGVQEGLALAVAPLHVTGPGLKARVMGPLG